MENVVEMCSIVDDALYLEQVFDQDSVEERAVRD
jgi:hypothetical protein